MKVLNVEKRRETLYIGLVEGKEYEGLVSPSYLSADSYIEKTIEIDTIVELFELNGEKYYSVIGKDENGDIVYTDIQENN